MRFKMSSLSDIWNESKVYVAGFAALLGIMLGGTFAYKTVVEPTMSSINISDVRATGNDDKDKKEQPSYALYDMGAYLSAYYNAATSPTGYDTLDKAKQGWFDKAATGFQALIGWVSGGNEDTPNGASLLTKSAIDGANEADDDTWTYSATWTTHDVHNITGGGVLLGFPDAKVVKGGILGWLASKTSSSTTDYSYSSLATRNVSKDDQYYNSLEAYAYYGATLQALGIDTQIGGGIFGWHPVRLVAGGVVWLLYCVASAVDMLFKVVINVLQATNPFKWFANAVDGINWYDTKKHGATPGALVALEQLIKSMYGTFQAFGWAIMVPILVAMLIYMFIFTGNGHHNPQLDQKRRNKIRYAFIYLLFLGLGVPILGTAYTSGLDSLQEAFNNSTSDTSVDRVILSSYVDNKTWITKSRMYVPSEKNGAMIRWNRKESDATSGAKAAVRQTALAINALNYPAAKTIVEDLKGADPGFNTNNTGKNNATGVDNVNYSVNSMLLSYMVGDSYEPGTWETAVKAKLTSAAESDKDLTNAIAQSAAELTKGYAYLGYVDPGTQDLSDYGGIKSVDMKLAFWKSDSMRYGSQPNLFLARGVYDKGGNRGGGGIIAQREGSGEDEVVTIRSHVDASTNPGLALPIKAKGGKPADGKAVMSYLEMYNYLNSEFTSNKIRVFSANGLMSNLSRTSHATVNQVGAGSVHKFMIWVNTSVMLLGLGVLGIGYAFGMLIGAFNRYFKVVLSIFYGTMGMQKGMVQAIAGTLMLICEIVGTLVLYQLIKTFYIVVPSLIEGALVNIKGGSGSATAVFGSGFATGVSSFLLYILALFALVVSTVVIIWMTIMFLRLRKPMMEIMDTTLTRLVDKLFYAGGETAKGGDNNGGGNPGGGMNSGLSALGGAAAGGALSNIAGADGNGWSNSGDDGGDGAASGAAAGGGDDDDNSPDAKVASSRETEETGSKLAAAGALDRSVGEGNDPDANSSSDVSGAAGEDGDNAAVQATSEDADGSNGAGGAGGDSGAAGEDGNNANDSVATAAAAGGALGAMMAGGDESEDSNSTDSVVASSDPVSGGLAPDADGQSTSTSGAKSTPVQGSQDKVGKNTQAGSKVAKSGGKSSDGKSGKSQAKSGSGGKKGGSGLTASASPTATSKVAGSGGKSDKQPKGIKNRVASAVSSGAQTAKDTANKQVTKAKTAANNQIAKATIAGKNAVNATKAKVNDVKNMSTKQKVVGTAKLAGKGVKMGAKGTVAAHRAVAKPLKPIGDKIVKDFVETTATATGTTNAKYVADFRERERREKQLRDKRQRERSERIKRVRRPRG